MKYFAVNQIICIFVYQIKQKTKHYENKNRNQRREQKSG